jgi:hypothetical protein
MDADDLWHPQKIEQQMAYLDVHPEVGVVTCYSAILDARGDQLGWCFDGQAQGMVYHKMLKQDLVAGGSVPLIRRDALHVVGPFDEALSLRSDWDMWLRLARRFAFGTVPQVLVGYTRRSGNASQDYEAMIELGASLLQKVAEDDADFKASRYRFCHARDIFAMACLCFIDEDAPRAWTYVRRSMGVSVWPVLGSLRRLGMVALITSSTVLPKGAYRLLFRMVARRVFRQQPGQPFLT